MRSSASWAGEHDGTSRDRYGMMTPGGVGERRADHALQLVVDLPELEDDQVRAVGVPGSRGSSVRVGLQQLGVTVELFLAEIDLQVPQHMPEHETEEDDARHGHQHLLAQGRTEVPGIHLHETIVAPFKALARASVCPASAQRRAYSCQEEFST